MNFILQVKEMEMNNIDVNVLLGKTITKIEVIKDVPDSDGDHILFHCGEDEIYKMYHSQDCCEYVVINDICGELDDLLDTPMLQAYESSEEDEDGWDSSTTWTFYNLATIKGYVTLRWIGTSNGYYSERVDFCRVK
jgi:uncharacterized protein YrzB (UPF0473 family)